MFVTSVKASLLVSNFVTAAESSSSAAPAFSLPGVSGEKTLADYRGQYLYVDFWASWCAPCRQSFPWMNEIQDKYADDGLKVIAINLDEHRHDADRFLEDVRADIDIAFDSEGVTAEAFNVRGMPSSYLINPDGEIIFSHIGFRKRDTALLEYEITKVIGGGE
ncbi:MAG: TlpA family protein disulfide reductase [Gammaproteobacteria bacterium]|nr:TlpA family protein disulfide reductase [Gammaproteobacteria bacterium]